MLKSGLFWALLLGPVWFSAPSQALDDLGRARELFRIDRIDVEGLRRVEKEAILEKLDQLAIRKGAILTNYLLKKSLFHLYAMKNFDSAEAYRLEQEGQKILLYRLKERPIISEVEFFGNEDLDDEDLNGAIKGKKFSILDVNTIKEDVKALVKLYEQKGYYLANVDYEIRPREAGGVKLIYRIKEFDKIRVKKIIFLGNRAFRDEQLKGVMETQEEGLFSFMSGSGNFKEYSFQMDVERIKYFYNTKGYLQANVGRPEMTVSEDKKWVFITLRVFEGPQFSVRHVSFQGETLFDEGGLRRKIQTRPGDFYSEEYVRRDIQLLSEMYQDEGYAFANVLRTLRPVEGENKVDVEFSFEKGKMAYFGKIIIKGNTQTRDKVIRRELVIEEGGKFKGSALRRSRENVDRLGFFEKGSVVFNTITSRQKDDVLDVEITVKEMSTGQLTLGAGYSSDTGAFVQGSVKQNNFLGRGQTLRFDLNWAKGQRVFSLGFTEPYFLDSLWTVGGGIRYSFDERAQNYRYKRRAFHLRVGRPIFDYTRLFFTYRMEDTELDGDHDDPTIDPQTENGLASVVRANVVRDTRNHGFEPSGGHYISMATEYAGLGGDKKWLKSEVDLRHFYNPWGDFVFRSRFYGGKFFPQGQEIPRTEKFALGGERNLRGYSYEAVGPKIETDQGRQFNKGGELATFVTLEIEHPLAREARVKWVLFCDAGHAGGFDDFKIYSNYGLGLRWFSPIGVMRFEMGFPLQEIGGDDGGQFNFGIGQLF